MFPLTRPVRQTLATVLLFGLTVLPTALVATFAWRINRPGHIRDVEIELGRQLGLQVTLEGVRYPRPGEVVYQGIVLDRRNRGARVWSRSPRRPGDAAASRPRPHASSRKSPPALRQPA